MRKFLKYVAVIYLSIFLIATPSKASNEIMPPFTHNEIMAYKEAKLLRNKINKLTLFISKKYKRDKKEIKHIVHTAFELGKANNFPTPIDILSIIAIESSFNKYAISSAKAIGLMQILYKSSSFDPRTNISDGVWLLSDYSRKLPISATIHAYNVGIGNYKAGIRNYNYLNKFKKVKTQLERI